MDAIFRILMQLEAVDRATNPINRVAGAISRLGNFARSTVGVLLGMAGAKGLFDWTITAAGNFQQMTLGMAAVLSAQLKLEKGLHDGWSAAHNANKGMEDFTLTATSGMINASKAAEGLAGKMEGVKNAANSAKSAAGDGQQMFGIDAANARALGISEAEYQEKRFQIAMADSVAIMEQLQRKAIVGIGTFENYAETANIIVGSLGKVLDLSTALGQAKFVNLVHLNQLAAAVLLPGRSMTQAFQIAGRELGKMLEGAATHAMPYVNALLAGIDLKKFNELSRDDRYRVIEERLARYSVFSKTIEGTWANIASAAAEFVQYIGRNIGTPIMQVLQDNIFARIPLVKDLLGKGGKPGETATQAEKRQMEAWDKVQAAAQRVGDTIASGLLVAADAFEFVGKHWDGIVQGLKAAAVAFGTMKGLALLSQGGSLLGQMGFAGRMLGRGAMPLAAGGLGGVGRAVAAGNAVGPIGMLAGRFFGLMNRGILQLIGRAVLLAQIGGFARTAGALTRVGLALQGIAAAAAAGVALFAWAAVIVAIGLAIMMVATNFMGIRDILVSALMGLWEALKAMFVSLLPILKVLGMVLLVVGAIIAGLVLAAIWLFIKGLTLLANMIGAVARAVVSIISRMAKVMSQQFQEIASGVVMIINWIIRQINRAISFAKGLPGIGKAFENIGPINEIGGRPGGFGVFGQLKEEFNGMLGKGKDFMAGMKDSFATAKDKLGSIKDSALGGGKLPPGYETNPGAVGGADEDGKNGKKGRLSHPKNVQIYQRGAIQIEIKNMNNYPPDRIAYDMKRILAEKTTFKTQGTSGGFDGSMHIARGGTY